MLARHPTTPCLLLPNDRSEAQVRAERAASFDDLVRARNARARQQCLEAAQRVAAGIQPQCSWMPHRYQIVREDDVQVVEACRDCGGRPRTYPAGKSSKHAVPYMGAL